MPRVSVITPVYNGERYLGEAIESVLRQTYRDWELIVVDDGSVDRSGAILDCFDDNPRLRVIRLEQNKGTATARNAAVTQSDSEFLAFLDADDFADHRRLEIQVRWMVRNPGVAVAGTRATVLRGNARFRSPPIDFPAVDIGANLLFRNCVIHSSAIMRRVCWQPYRPEFEPAEDYDLWARLAIDHRFAVLRDLLVTYRDHRLGVSYRFADKMKTAVQGIHRFQLERMGVIPNEDIHFRLSAWPADAAAADLRDAERWLFALEAQNRVFNPKSLRRTIERIWYSICLGSNSLGPQAFQIYRHSSLRRLTPSCIWEFARHFGRRLIFESPGIEG